MSPSERVAYLENLIQTSCHALNSALGVVLWASVPKRGSEQECLECRTEIMVAAKSAAAIVRDLAKAATTVLLLVLVLRGQDNPRVGDPIPNDPVQRAQKGAPQNAAGLSPAEVVEFKKLRDANANQLRLIIEGNARISALEQVIDTLDPVINTRMVTQHEDSIKALKEWQRMTDDNRTKWEGRMWSVTQAVLVLVAGMALTGAAGIGHRLWSRYHPDPRDPDRRSAVEIDARNDLRLKDFTAHVDKQLEAVKGEVAETLKAVGTPKDWKDLGASR